MPIDADGYEISTDRARIDLDWLHDRLSTDTYWAPGRPRERVERALDHSVCYGVYHPDGHQVAFARLVTDHTIIAWLGDVYVDRSVRGTGIGLRLIARIMSDIEPMELRRMILSTKDASGLYERFGFGPQEDRDEWMQIVWEEHL